MNETKKVSKKQKTTKGNMRRNILMIILCIALLSSATYAWFTLSDSARITNLSLSVTEASGLLIAGEKVEDGNKKPLEYASVLDLTALESITAKLTPITLGTLTGESTNKLLAATYDGDKITEYAAATKVMTDETSDTADYHYYEKVFYLKTSASNLNLVLMKNSSADATDGTYVKDNTSTPGVAYPACDAIRIAFYDAPVDGTETLLAVYEPNADQTWGTTRTDKVSAANIAATNATLFSDTTKTIQQNKAGTFTGSNVNGDNSMIIKKLASGEDNRMIMRVYFDGNDPECCNVISLNKIIGQLKFTTIADPTP